MTIKGYVSNKSKAKGVTCMLWTLAGILLVLWILGLIFKVAGGIIHILLVIAAIIIVVNFIRGRASGRG